MILGDLMSWYTDIIKKRFRANRPSVVYVEEHDDITDEIERSLWDIKEHLDLPTEEIERSLQTRRDARLGIIKPREGSINDSDY